MRYEISLDNGKTVSYIVETTDELNKLLEKLAAEGLKEVSVRPTS